MYIIILLIIGIIIYFYKEIVLFFIKQNDKVNLINNDDVLELIHQIVIDEKTEILEIRYKINNGINIKQFTLYNENHPTIKDLIVIEKHKFVNSNITNEYLVVSYNDVYVSSSYVNKKALKIINYLENYK